MNKNDVTDWQAASALARVEQRLETIEAKVKALLDQRVVTCGDPYESKTMAELLGVDA